MRRLIIIYGAEPSVCQQFHIAETQFLFFASCMGSLAEVTARGPWEKKKGDAKKKNLLTRNKQLPPLKNTPQRRVQTAC